MYGPFQKARHVLRGGAALVLALLLCAAMPARAAGVTAGGADQDTSARMLVPVGHTVGIKLFARGVMVVKAPESGTPADDCGLQTGDIIVKCGGVSVTSSEQFQSLLQENGETATDLQVRREGGSVTLSVSPEQNEKGAYCIGAWIRDSMAGIGTMTYYDPESGAFGALGHGITDADTALLMPFASGSILPSTVKAVKKGAIGEAGELRGDFDLATDLGDLYANTTSGVFGTLDPGEFTERLGDPMPVAAAGEVHAGPATILSNVEGDAVQEYDVEILQVVENAADGRDLVISVTDPELSGRHRRHRPRYVRQPDPAGRKIRRCGDARPAERSKQRVWNFDGNYAGSGRFLRRTRGLTWSPRQTAAAGSILLPAAPEFFTIQIYDSPRGSSCAWTVDFGLRLETAERRKVQ